MNCERVRELAPGFVLSALEPAELAAVQEHLARCTKPHDEFRELGGVVPYLAEMVDPVEPPERLREAILEAAQSDLRARRRSDQAAERLVATLGGAGTAGARREPRSALHDESPTLEPAHADRAPGVPRVLTPVNGETQPVTASPVASAGEAPEGAIAARVEAGSAAGGKQAASQPAAVVPFARAIRRRPAGRAVSWLLRIAAVVLVLGLGARAVVLQDEATHAQRAADAAQKALGAIAQATAKATMAPAPGSSVSGVAMLQPTGHVFVYLYGLEPTKGSDVYVIWFRADGGAPVPAASFTTDTTFSDLDILSVPNAAVLEVFVTLEPKAGGSAPTAPELAMGTIVP